MTFPSLPIDPVLPHLLEALRHASKAILQAPPGAGKTTAVPLALLNEPWLEGKRILLLEPRRLAARAAATRMAEMLGEAVGERVGYHIRSEKKFSSETRILVITEGILTRYLQNDPALENVGIVLFDEFHERHLHSDLSLAFALQSQELFREELKLLVMSATLDVRGLGDLMDHPPLITSEGRSHPVTITYRSPSLPPVPPKEMGGELLDTLRQALRNEEGDILVFLPGEREIRDVESRLRKTDETRELFIAPLYGNLTKEEQHRAILPAERRKIVLATNIAETSLTIEGIQIVVDSGLERVSRFDPTSGMERLLTQKISRASADQRAGRAGRTAAGRCYRLWSEPAHHSLPPYREPEMAIADLTPLALELAAWGAEADDLRWIDPPKNASLDHARGLLESLGALRNGSITPHGRSLLSLGIHPRLSHMILRGRDEGLESEAILVAALLHERDILKSDERHADLRERFWTLKEALRAGRPTPPLQPLLQRVREIAARRGTKLSFQDSESPETVALLLSFAYPDRIAKSRGNGKFLTSGGKEAYLGAQEELGNEAWLVIAQSDGDATSSRIRLCAPITLQTLQAHHPEAFRTEPVVEWNPETRRVEARRNERLGAIVVSSRPLADPDPDRVRQTLLEGIRQHGLDSLGWNESTRTLQRRLSAFHALRPELCPADFGDAALLASLEHWLLPHLGGESSLRELEGVDWETILLSALGWKEQQEFNRLLPPTFTAPTGNRLPIDYADPAAPILSVRIQEMFGTSLHPALMDGTLPLTLHLLSPARRPIQVTRDLPRFWSGSYAEVKKELKGRYPKHFWPDDPAAAPATTKTKKQMDSSATKPY